jgi:hypothetical protein
MKRLTYLPPVLFLALCLADPAAAEPAWGANCLSCHGQWQTDTVYVIGEDTIADPDESQTGAPDRGPLPVFQTFPGRTKSLQTMLASLQTDDTYAVELKRLRFAGVEQGRQLSYTGDCAWPEWGEHARYYSDPVVSHRWGVGPTTFTFDIDIELDAGYDYYDLVFAVAGKRESDGELFYAEEHFYLQVMVGPGDLNCDGTVNGADIDAFVLALTDPAGYAAAYPACDIKNGDCNSDGTINGLDIDPFVTLLTAN